MSENNPTRRSGASDADRASRTQAKVMDGYIRVSRKAGRLGEAYQTVKIQREAIQRWADYRGVRIAEWHIDEDESGSTQNRPGLRAAMERIQIGATGGLVCWRLDRFGRNVKDALGDIQAIQAAGAAFVAVGEEDAIDTSTATGEMVLTMLLAVARMQWVNLKTGWTTSRSNAVERGAFVGIAPFGYVKVKDPSSPRVGCLDPDPTFGVVVTEAFRRAATAGIHAAQSYLIERVPERNWRLNNVRRLLASKVYLGVVKHGPELVNENAHAPLTTLKNWTAANAAEPKQRKRANTYPLSGIARCAGCNGPLVGQRGHVRVDGSAGRNYRCSYKWNAGTECPAPAYAQADALERFVDRELRDNYAAVRETLGLAAGDVDLTALQTALEDAEALLTQYAEDLEAQRGLGDTAWRAGIAVRRQAVEDAHIAYQDAVSRITPHQVLPLVTALDDREEYERALRTVVSHVGVHAGRGPIEERASLVFIGENDDLGTGVLAA